MRKSPLTFVRKRWPILALTSVVLGGATVGVLRLRSAAEGMLPGFLKTRLEAALGRSVEFGKLHVFPTGLWIEQFRVPKMDGEAADPVVAKGIRVSADWWSLVNKRQVIIDEVTLEGAQLRLSPTAALAGKGPWTRQVLQLAGTGIQRFGIKDASIQFLSGKKGEVAWSAENVDGGVKLQPASFNYEARVDRFNGSGVSLAGVKLAGSGDAKQLRVSQATVAYDGGLLAADGTVEVADNATDLRLRVNGMPLSKLAARIGIPQEWAVKGKLTGTLNVDARDNSVRSIRGTLQVDRGSFTRPGGQLPWETAQAKVEWTPDHARLSDVKVSADGLTLTANGKVALRPGQAFTDGAFDLDGRIVASRSGSVARMAELLAFRRVLEGRWEAGSAVVRFDAHGKVGDLDAASATGKLQVKSLRFRPVADQDAATIDHLAADLERAPASLVLKNIVARTEGFTVLADATLTDDRPGRPAQFRVDGSADVRDMKSLNRALPQAALWTWIPIASPRASGKLAFRAGGPLASPADLWSDGTFEAHNFRLSATSTLPSGAVFLIPVKSARGTFHHAARQFQIKELALDTRSFDATGRVLIDFRGEVAMETELRIVTDNWRGLPTMPPNAMPELTGGRLVATLKQSAPMAQMATAPVHGSFLLTGASYLPGREGATAMPVDRFGADFHWADRILQLPQVTISTPVLEASAQGRIYEATDRNYHMAMDVKAASPAVSELVERFTTDFRLEGGTAEARFQMDGPVTELTEAALHGTLELKDAKVDYPVEILGLRQIDARRLSTDFSRGSEGWTLTRAEVDAPGVVAQVSGIVAPDRTDAAVSVQMDGWTAPQSLPITGGSVSIDGRVTGETARQDTLAFSGDVNLQNAGLRVSGADYALEGGKLSLDGGLNVSAARPEEAHFTGDVSIEGARGRFTHGKLAINNGTVSLDASGAGVLNDPAHWLKSGRLEVTDAVVANDGKSFPKVERLTAALVRDGERIRWTEAKLAAGGSTLESSGSWSPAGHELDLTAKLGDLAPFGVKLPAGVSAGASKVAVHVTGTRERPVVTAVGRVDLSGVKLALAGAPEQAFERIGGGFHLEDGVLKLDGLKGEGPAGTVTASGTWSEERHNLTVLAEGGDFGKLGVELPDGFRLQGFRLEGELNGTAAKPLSALKGRVRLTGAAFPFGPNGPHKLDTVEATLAGSGANIKLSNIAASGPAGRYTGAGEITEKGYRLALQVPQMDPAVVRWLLPGEVQGGTLSGTLNIGGTDQEPVNFADGHFDLRNAKYVAPVAFQIADTATPVSRFRGDYAWNTKGTRLTNLQVDSPLLTATGALTADGEAGNAQVDIKSANLGGVVDYWPALKGWLEGGTASGRLETTFKGAVVQGTLTLKSQGGTLSLPGVTGDFATHPVETASMVLGFAPGKLTFDDVKVRGPKGNADGEGSWAPNGAVYGAGKAWFSKGYTKKLMPKGVGWLAGLFGLKEIKSDFTIEGDAEKVHLNAGITRSFIWKFAKGQVPKEFQEIAKGKAPLWVKPLDVAEAPAPKPHPVVEKPIPTGS